MSSPERERGKRERGREGGRLLFNREQNKGESYRLITRQLDNWCKTRRQLLNLRINSFVSIHNSNTTQQHNVCVPYMITLSRIKRVCRERVRESSEYVPGLAFFFLASPEDPAQKNAIFFTIDLASN